MAALVAVMIMVSIGTFSWRSLRDLRTHPRSSSAVMLLTVVVTVVTHDLAKGVLSGVLLSALFFARKVGRMLDVQREDVADMDMQVYRVRGQVFFASAGQLGAAFDYQHVTSKVQIDLRDAHLWDLTAVAALQRAQEKLAAHGAEVSVVGLNAASQTLIEQVGGRSTAGIAH
jgi:SulP family sulfate permease